MKYFVDPEDGSICYQLQRCPFCGKDESLEVVKQSDLWNDYELPVERFTVVCSWNKKGCGATCGFHSTKQKAVSRWNTRVVI